MELELFGKVLTFMMTTRALAESICSGFDYDEDDFEGGDPASWVEHRINQFLVSSQPIRLYLVCFWGSLSKTPVTASGVTLQDRTEVELTDTDVVLLGRDYSVMVDSKGAGPWLLLIDELGRRFARQ